jgi:phosphocarrier protein
MMEKTITISNRAGLHARPSAMIVKLTKDMDCDVSFVKDDDRINAKSIMGLLTLGAAYGTELTIITEGAGEKEALDAIVKLFESKFQEEDDA